MVVLALGFGAFLLSTLLLVQHNLLRELRVDRGAARPNLVFFDVQPDQKDDVVARMQAEGPLTAPAVPIVPMRIQSLKGRPASELLAIEDEKQRPERWALRREYRSSYRDAPGRVGARRRGRVVARRRVEGARGRGRGAGRGGGGPRARARGGRSATRSCGTSRACRSPRASRSCARWSGRASSPTSSSSSPRARSTPHRRASCSSRAWTTPSGAPTCSARWWRRTRTSPPSTSPRCSGRSRASSTRWSSPSASWPSSASPRGRSCSRGPWPRAATSACARARSCGRSGRGAPSSCGSCSRSTPSSAPSPPARRSSSRRPAGWALVRFVFDVSFALPGPRAPRPPASPSSGLTVVVGLSGSTEVWRRPPLEVLRAE